MGVAQECCVILPGQRTPSRESCHTVGWKRGNQRPIVVSFLDLPEAALEHSSGEYLQTVLKISTPPFIPVRELPESRC